MSEKPRIYKGKMMPGLFVSVDALDILPKFPEKSAFKFNKK